ncbi:hypothetical protein CF386_00095 [Paraphotobacterium marinum]|uniref:Flagellar motor switch protein FliN-like C-terminal domain-containing protein n=1 Tax=Paraphotobacterium marinum TaxID=1755811 RepID=A0A220VB10_9GAMM|nr:FliM/FliN family flagellar motor C-terminal domain-containing protein [Paraphotobacterium marinum]ASK77604.1 hypothetical protein CF386_00095 [Paraphotobacterium marinum]
MGKIILDDKEKKLPKLQNEYLGHSIHIIKNKLITIFNTERPSIKKDIKQSLNQTINVSVDEITIEHQSDILNFLTHSPSYLKHQLQGFASGYMSKKVLLFFSDHFYQSDVFRISNAPITNSDLRFQEKITKVLLSYIAPKDMWEVSKPKADTGLGLKITFNIECEQLQDQMVVFLDSKIISVLEKETDILMPREKIIQCLHKNLETIPIKVSATLTQKSMKLSDVLKLKENDIIETDLFSSIPIHVGSSQLFEGKIVEKDKQLIIVIQQERS